MRVIWTRFEFLSLAGLLLFSLNGCTSDPASTTCPVGEVNIGGTCVAAGDTAGDTTSVDADVAGDTVSVDAADTTAVDTSTPAVTLPFALDDYFIPSGYMGNDAGIDASGTCPTRAGDEGGVCHAFTFTPGASDPVWGGVFWQYPENNWGDLPGLEVPAGVTGITFWAWGAVGGEVVAFGSGYGADSDGYAEDTGAITLTTTPTQYTLDLTGITYTDIAGGFSWTSPGAATITFYVDDIVMTNASTVPGCTDPLATNYDPSATGDDGSCTYGPVALPFAIDDYYSPSGFMGNVAGIVPDVACPVRADQAEGDCHGFTFTPGTSDPIWGGVFWQYPENNWQDETDPPAGLVIEQGLTAITFSAWGAVGGEVVTFGSGYGVDKDGYAKDTGGITLTTTPTQYTLDLTGITYTDIAGGFSWVIAGGAPVTFYIDDIQMTKATVTLGCTDPTANNYNASANVDDGSCTFDPIALPFALDNYYVPSGYMGNTAGVNAEVACPVRAGDEMGDCHGFTYTPGDPAWGGVFWQYPEDNWKDGSVKGLFIAAGASSVTFWAWGAVGGEVLKFGSGYGTADGFSRETAPITLTTTPTKYTVDLLGVSYTDVAGGFKWVSEGAGGAVTFYIDDIVMNATTGTPGCTDASANNYNAAATIDDGSCVYMPTTAAPTPTTAEADVISVFSDAYTDISGVNTDPDWGQATDSTVVQIAGNDTLSMTGLTYQGIDFEANAQDVSAMDTLHIDFWTHGATKVNLYVISAGSVEKGYALPLDNGTWVSLDIPLSAFSPPVDLSQVIQFKFDRGDSQADTTVFVDNLYFYDGGTGGGCVPTLPELTVNGGFEEGDISCWTDFSAANNGTFAATMDQAKDGTWSGHLVASGAGSFPVVKQANLGIGTVTPNTEMVISFDMYGSVSGAGGVFFAEFFSEITGGGTSSAVLLGGGPLFPTGTWTHYEFTQMTGADVSAGVTLQLKADCGGNADCVVDAYIDNVSVMVGGGGTADAPDTAAPTPTAAPEDVISVFSDAYTNIDGVNTDPDWGQATDTTVVPIAGNDTLKMAGLNYQGIDFTGNPQDVSGMDMLHIDFWTPDATKVNLFLVGDGGEKAYALPVAQGTWVSVDIPLGAFSPPVALTAVKQFKFDRADTTEGVTVFVDNLYFFDSGAISGCTDPNALNYDAAATVDNGSCTYPASPLEAAPTPMVDEADVISVFSDAYTNIDGVDTDPNWGQATDTTIVSIDNSDTIKMAGLNYQGISWETNAQDVSGMDMLHVDFWTGTAGSLAISLVGGGEKAYALPLAKGVWVSVDIPLSAFSPPVVLSNVIQFKFEGSGTVFVDNLYFFREVAPVLAADVFTDDYAEGVSFEPFGGSTNSLSVDTTQFHSGTASLKIPVGAGDYTGGTLIAAAPADASAFNAVTFWAKADVAGKNLNGFGLGNDNGDKPFEAETRFVDLNTTWTKYIVPIPDPAKLTAHLALFHFAEGSDQGTYTIWLDDIRYEQLDGVFTNPRPTIPSVSLVKAVGDMFTVPAGGSLIVAVNGTDQTLVVGGAYFSLISADPAVATVTDGVAKAVGVGTTTLTATLAGVAATGTLNLDVSLLGPDCVQVGDELTMNGGFEAGNIACWQDFSGVNNGTFAATMDQAKTGSWSGHLVASGAGSFPVVKQPNLGIGTVTPNTSMTIEFDLYGSTSGAGGVFFAEFFSELTGGGTSSAVILGGGPLFPTGTWTHYSFTTPTGADVTGGVTLQLKADCGGNADCVVDAYIDNVSVKVTP